MITITMNDLAAQELAELLYGSHDTGNKLFDENIKAAYEAVKKALNGENHLNLIVPEKIKAGAVLVAKHDLLCRTTKDKKYTVISSDENWVTFQGDERVEQISPDAVERHFTVNF